MSAPAAVQKTWRAYWDAHNGQLGAAPPPFLLECLLHEVQPRPGLRVLEAGSGTGGLARELAARGAVVTVLDIIRSCVRHAAAVSGLRAVQADLFRAPFRDGSFDVVFNSGVMEHFEPAQLAAGVREMGRLLRPGGKLIVVVPSARGKLYLAGKRRLEQAGRWDYGIEYPQASLAEFMRAAGLGNGSEYLAGVRWQARFLEGWRGCLARLAVRPFAENSRIGCSLFGAYLLVSAWQKQGDARP